MKQRHSQALIVRASTLIVTLLGAGFAYGQPYAEVADLDNSECENTAGEYGDICLVNPGETGVGKMIFDTPVRRVLRDNSGPVGAPPAVVALEGSGTVRLTPTDDLVVLSESAMWLVCKRQNDVERHDIEDRPQLPKRGLAKPCE